MPDTEPTIVHYVTRRGRQYGVAADGTNWTRRVPGDTTSPPSRWVPISPVLPPSSCPPPSSLSLAVIMENQTESEAKHWSLFCYAANNNNTRRGRAWQVTGDAEFMRYAHEDDADKFGGEAFAWCLVLREDGVGAADVARIEEAVDEERPPSAPSRREVRENCQGWVVRVVKRLVTEGVVEEAKVDALERYMDPVD